MKRINCKIFPGFWDYWNSKLATTLRLTGLALLIGIFQGHALENDNQHSWLNPVVKNNTPTEMVSFAQQQGQVSGKVTDKSGSPLPGVTVAVKGTTQGTITDADGAFSLNNLNLNATLIFSFVGMKTQEVNLEGRTSVYTVMEEIAIGLDEVVAIGYGTQKRGT